MIILKTIFVLNLCISVNASHLLYYSSILQGSYQTYDCLHASLVDGEKQMGINYVQNYHLIPYCRRPDNNEEQDETQYPIRENIIQTLSFEQLKRQSVTSEQLLRWFSAIDVAEDYERFFNDSDVFHNCSSPWFGSMCQYKFPFEQNLSLEDIIQITFKKQDDIRANIFHGTCYRFLTNCNGRSWPLCLDWHNICDGKFDCMNGDDEGFCDQLELTKCNDDEYRCHFGGQCIPQTFLKDGRFSIDCLDGSDESDRRFLGIASTNAGCTPVPSFRCQERIGRYFGSFQCGDGEYLIDVTLPNIMTYCSNEKDKKVSLSLLTNMEHISNIDCQKTFYCALHANRTFGYGDIVGSGMELFPILEDIRDEDCEPLSKYCESEWLVIPVTPILFGFFQFVYFTNRSVNDFRASMEPDLICFHEQACPALLMNIVPTHYINGLTCFPPLNFSLFYEWNDFNDVFSIFSDYNRYCRKKGTETFCTNLSDFYCNKSMKCISYNRIGDGQSDCYYGEDEQFNACHLNDSNRFQCLSDPTKCLLQIAVGDGIYDCHGEEDEIFAYSQDLFVLLPYPYMCNIVPNTFILMYERNETDETNCHWWPCDNPYTHCDEHWNCPNGIDELNCPNSRCSYNKHDCSVQQSESFYCISLTNMYDKYLNSCNETYIKRNVYFYNETNDISEDYVSWNDNKCVTFDQLCPPNSPLDISFFEENICLYSSEHLYWMLDKIVKLIPNDEYLCTFHSALSGIIPPYFKTSRLGYYPSLSINHSNSLLPQANSTSRLTSNMDNESISYCNRGILVLHGSNQTKTCFCPPNYFGSRCQWQNQRISLTIQLVWRSMTFQMTIFELIIMLIDEHGQIEAYYERITYMPDRDCNTKYNLYLLYPDRPKSILRNYSIRIDIYEKINVIYWLSWYLPIPFQFLPVNRIATQIRIPELPNHESCTLSCGEHGKCMNYINNKSLSFCLCNDGYSSTDCNIKHQCHCADDSFCLTSTICICPLNKFGSYCHLKHSSCQTKTNNSCEHNGVCIPVDDRISLTEFTCFCPEDYSGKRCEIENTRIDIYLNEEIRSITSLVLIHFITSFNHGEHERRTLLRKISFNQKILTVYNTKSFHILFVQIPNKYYYLTILREVFHPSEHIRTEIQLKKRCFSIDQLILNETFQQYEYLRRVKYYPLLCRKNLELECFHDHEQMCLCDQDRFANCFLFNHTINNDCPGYNYCENQGQCFQNNATCPTKLTCICRDCYYGGKCQFSTRGFIFSLDTILAYHIKPKISLTEQSLVVKISIVISTILLLIGIINGLLAFVTFRRIKVKQMGSGYYLLFSSIFSIFTIITLTYKFWLLILSQTSFITNQSLLYFNCITIDVLLRILLASSEWCNCCVSIERMFSVIMATRFQRKKSVKFSKRIILIVFILVTLTHIHEPPHRQLIDDFDIDEHRIWCFVRYSSLIENYNSFIILFHFLTPFSINIISSLWMIIQLAYRRRGVERGQTVQHHLKHQIQQHQHLLYSPLILILLSLPRLIISFTRTCMRSTQQPWLFLIGYFLSFVPSMSIFVVFVLPSKTYKTEFNAVIEKIFKKFRTPQ